jgi:hypothetical protein
MTACEVERPSRPKANDARTFEPRVPRGRPRGSDQAVVKAGRRQHCQRVQTATRIARVAETWSGPIWALMLLWATVSLRVKPGGWWWNPVRTPRLDFRPSRPDFGPSPSLSASSAASHSPRRRTPGFRCLTRFVGELSSRRGRRHERGASCHDGVDPIRGPCHPIEPPRRRRRVRGMLV